MIVSFRTWVADWKTEAHSLEDAGDKASLSITASHAGADFVVLILTLYDAETDEGRKLARTTSKAFDNKVALYSHRTRDTGLARVITNKGSPVYVLQRGPDALRWAAAVEGMSVDSMVVATRAGAAERGIARRARQQGRTTEELKEMANALSLRIFDAQQELGELEAEFRAVSREIELSSSR